MVARRVHTPEVTGSNPVSAILDVSAVSGRVCVTPLDGFADPAALQRVPGLP